ncbi:MAG: hypothetical protein KIT14_11800 [bacterium]|nr:hypothetical protein [bacterium]
MYRSGTYFSALASFWGGVAEDATTRCRRAWTEIEERRYSPASLFSDGVGFWTTTVEQYWSSILSNASTPVPVVLFEVSVGAKDPRTATQSKTAAVPLGLLAPDRAPHATPLACIATEPAGANRVDIPAANVHVTVTPNRNELEVSLVGLADVHLGPGHYWGLVYAAGTPLATVHVVATA